MAQSNVIPATTESTVSRHGDRSIGAILVHARRLTIENAEHILRLQREQSLSFGDAGIKLGLLTQADIEFALSLQFNYPYLLRGESKVSENLVAAYSPSGPQAEALRGLRSQLMLRWFDSDRSRKALAVVSADRNEGRSYIAASLAVVFSQLGERTLLIDADMRNPSQHEIFGLDNRAGLSAVLSGRGGHEAIQRIPALLDLSVLPAGAGPPNPQELLARPLFTQLLNDLAQTFDVILLDSPSTAECTDAHTVAHRAGAALVVARKNVTRMRLLRGVFDAVSQASATVVGTVLVDF